MSLQFNSRLSYLSDHFVKMSEQPEHQAKLLKLTLSGLIITFTVILFSCQTPQQTQMPSMPQSRRFESPKSERELDQLYLKRDEMVIRNRENGSSTGSIWADANEPRTLLVDPAPSREGQTVTVMIPAELQFDPKSVVAADTKKKDKKEGEKDKKEADDNQNGLKLTDPDSASPAIQLSQAPIKSLKMQIVGFEPGGDVYLRGTRKFTSASGEDSMIMVLAKVPRRSLTSYELDARALTDVAVNEDMGGKQREYSAAGWDEIVSRRLAGFSPDVKSEMDALEGLREEVRTAQTALRDQAKANEAERERIRKERERMAAQAAAKSGETAAPAAEKPAGSKE